MKHAVGEDVQRPLNQVLTLARYSLIEALRNRLALLVVLVAIVSVGIAVFLRAIAITETAQIQAAVLAALLRVAAVFLTAAFVITSQVREAADKGLELLLSHAFARSQYVLGKLSGYVACAALITVLFAVPLLAFAPPVSVITWGVSLFLELCIIAGASLFCVLTFSHIVVSLTAVAGFYFLSRSIATLQVMGTAQIQADAGWHAQIASVLLDAIAFALPRLDLFTQTAWLIYPSEHDVVKLGLLAAQSLIYTLLLGAAALFDFYRKNL